MKGYWANGGMRCANNCRSKEAFQDVYDRSLGVCMWCLKSWGTIEQAHESRFAPRKKDSKSKRKQRGGVNYPGRLTIEHIAPYWLGGESTTGNYALACQKCNCANPQSWAVLDPAIYLRCLFVLGQRRQATLNYMASDVVLPPGQKRKKGSKLRTFAELQQDLKKVENTLILVNRALSKPGVSLAVLAQAGGLMLPRSSGLNLNRNGMLYRGRYVPDGIPFTERERSLLALRGNQ